MTTTTGKPTQKAKRLPLKSLKPDDPIYSHGFVIGGKGFARSSKNTSEKADDKNRDKE